MKGYILMPRRYSMLGDGHTDAFDQLFLSMREWGFEIHHVDTMADLSLAVDIIIIFGGVHGKGLICESVKLPKHIKVVLYIDGVHGFGNDGGIHNEAMQHADLILSGSNELFRYMWPEFVDRFVFFPNFFATHSRFASLPIAEHPTMKCLLSGHTSISTYPLRVLIRNAVEKNNELQDTVDIMLHPRWWQGQWEPRHWEILPVVRDNYARCLNSYFCSVATTSKYKYLLAKYFEIPAAGSLLLANNAPDVEVVGLIANKHFVEINKYNFKEKIRNCLNRPEKYQEMKLEAMEYVRTNHSLVNRIKLFREILGGLA